MFLPQHPLEPCWVRCNLTDVESIRHGVAEAEDAIRLAILPIMRPLGTPEAVGVDTGGPGHLPSEGCRGDGLGRLGSRAVAPEQIQPPARKPADFDAFWAGKLAALKQVPINPRLEPAATDRAGVELSTVTLDSLNSQVHGYLATPKGGGKHPALVIYQYAGVYALQKTTVTDRAAEGWLAFNVDSHDMPPDQATAPRDYASIGNTSRETSYFLNMYLRDTRALDYIQSRPDWDGKTIVIWGMSMGGQQSFATAGLNPDRVTAMVVNVPL